MYSSLYGPPAGRQYIGRDSSNYRAYSANADYSSLASATVGGSPSTSRRYNMAPSGSSNDPFPPSRYRPPLPTYTMQSVSRSSSYANSANQNKNLPGGDVGYANSRTAQRPTYRRSMSLSPSRIDEFKYRETIAPVRSMIRESFREHDMSGGGRGLNGHALNGHSSGGVGHQLPPRPESSHHAHGNGSAVGMAPSHNSHAHNSSNSTRLVRRSPSVAKERTRDELIDSIVHTRTREHRVMPGFHDASDWEERKALGIDCDKVYPGIILGNGETIQNVEYLRKIGVTHVLNTAERHVPVNPAKYPLHGISYFGFHVDDHPMSNVSRFFGRTTDFIEEAMSRSGLIVVNCVMGWSRSATVVAAYLMMKKGMSSAEALQTIRQSRPIRPNPGFLQQLADHENLLNKKPFW